MLEAIKSIINRKMNFLEAADIILEDYENNEIMNSLIDDEIADSGEIGSSKDDLKLDDLNNEEVPEASVEDEYEAIMSVPVDTRNNKVITNELDAKLLDEDTNPMDSFLDEHVTNKKIDYYFFLGESEDIFNENKKTFSNNKTRLENYFFIEDVSDMPTMPTADSDSGGAPPPAPDSSSDSSSSDSSSDNKETEVTTAVKEELADDQTSSSDDLSNMDNFGSDSSSDSSSDFSSSSSSSDANKTEKGKELLKQAKKLEDNIIDFFF